jgi:hypothetical protein
LSPEQFWQLVEKQPDGGCWLWQGTKDRLGYGRVQMRIDGVRVQLAHRAAFILTHGYHPPALDHVCQNTSCVNPDPAHLDPCGQRENMRRAIVRGGGESFPWRAAQAWAEGRCLNGHDLTPENIGVNGQQRFCRECRRATVRRHNVKRRSRAVTAAP